MTSTSQTQNPEVVFDAQPSPAVRVRSWSQPEQRSYPVGAHPQVELAVVEQGGVEYDLGTSSLVLEPGQVVHLAPGVEHRTKIAPGTRATSLWVEAERASVLRTGLGLRHKQPVFRLEDAQRVAAMAATLVAESKAGGAGLVLLSDAIVDALLTLVHRQIPAEKGSTAKDPRVSAALEYAQDNYAEDISVDDMAQVAGISRFHFSRLFREQTGMSPYRFLTETRPDSCGGAALHRDATRSLEPRCPWGSRIWGVSVAVFGTSMGRRRVPGLRRIAKT